jgi:superfamily II DNA or RNA helicase
MGGCKSAAGSRQQRPSARASGLRLPPGLWEHQRKAVEVSDAYLRSASGADRAALITMPTGTGKTGVIAATVTLLPSLSGHRLVITPWDALVRQLEDDLRGRFWSRLPATQRPALPRVRHLPASSDFEQLRRTSEPTIFVATIAAVSVLARRAPELGYKIDELFSGFDCLIVDEGHYEPAYRWSQAIRSLRRPTILLTATPYRNDEKFFRIGDHWRYRFPHHEAEEQRFLRRPQFQTIPAGDPERFVRGVVAFVDETFGVESDVRTIIRCADADGIRAVVRALQQLGKTDVLGVHERFPPQDGVLFREVPSSGADARYWVHQYKLIEGIDDPRFKVVAFYDSLRNDRAIVQQIGRVLRNPRQDPADVSAFVIDRGDRELSRVWDAYRKFDQQPEAQSIATVPDLAGRVLAAQPEAFYYDGGYRTKIDLDDENAWHDFAFPLRTRVFRSSTKPGLPIEVIADAVVDEWIDIDRSVYSRQMPDVETVIVPYVAAENSPLLRTGTFIEPKFGYTFLRRSNELLFIYDARGRTPRVVDENFQPLVPIELQCLFPNSSSTLTSVSLLNTDIGRQAARSRQIRATAIDELAPDLADYAYVCSIVEGYTEIEEKRFRRYLGLSRSRITDHRTTERDYETYSRWLGTIELHLANGAKRATAFDRYAKLLPTPSDSSPVHVLLDVDPGAFEQRRGTEVIPLELGDSALEVAGSSISIVVNQKTHAATFTWDPSGGRYLLESPSLREEAFVDGENRELVSVVNEEQALRVVPATRTALYSHGHFFQPILPTKRVGAFQLLDILHPVEELASVSEEKGSALVDDDWSPDCVFGLISALDPASRRSPPRAMEKLLSFPDLLLCTDLGTEMCDFLATQGDRVVLLHAKASRKLRPYSASALHDVASQAIKNLPYLQPLSEIKPQTGRWMQAWKLPGTSEGTRRLRVGTFASGAEIWKHVRRVISNPNGEREVWLVIGHGLSKNALERQAQRPAPEAMQVFSLLQTTWGAVSQLGARLRILCSP